MQLAAIEALIAAALDGDDDPLARLQAEDLVRVGGAIAPPLALRIYRDSVAAALAGSLATAYPACRRILGDACFNGVARQFTARTPSRQPDLNRYGETFGGFLDTWTATRPAYADYRYLGDLARLEWLCHTAYYAADDPPFDVTALTGCGTERLASMRLQPGRSVGLLRSAYPVREIRDVNLAAGDTAEVRAGELPQHLVVSRPGAEVSVAAVDAATFSVLAACRAGRTLAQIVARGAPGPQSLSALLVQLVQHRWITAVSVGGPAPGNPRHA